MNLAGPLGITKNSDIIGFVNQAASLSSSSKSSFHSLTPNVAVIMGVLILYQCCLLSKAHDDGAPSIFLFTT